MWWIEEPSLGWRLEGMGQDELRFKYGECQVPVGHAEGCPKGSWTDKPGAQGYVPSIVPASASRW